MEFAMPGLIRLFAVIALSLLLYACGGGDSAWNDSDSPTDTTPTPTPDPEDVPIYLGRDSGASFTPGTLNIGVASLAAGGQTSVTATLADENGNLYQESANVSFTSVCVVSSLSAITSPITTTDGVATTTYNAQGCSGSDTITATTTVRGATRTATGALTVQPAVIGSMQFVSATPSIIGIRGFGLTEVAEVIFRVLDTNGNPVSNEIVNFTLNSSVGGVNLPNTSDTSDADGLVRVDVQSGTVSTTVRVTATLASNPSISTQSDGLTISTGIADQDSVSLAVSNENPEALEIDGVVVVVTAYAADHFNNPVPDGTAVTFTTEGGQIQSQCLTTDGSCTVNWTSSGTRPPLGRSTILATLQGEESFYDQNGDHVLTAGEAFTDVPEAFRDDDEDGVFSAANDAVFLDYNSNGTHDAGDNLFNGVLCCDDAAIDAAAVGDACYGVAHSSGYPSAPDNFCSTQKNIHVRADNTIVMAATDLYFNPISGSYSVSGEGVLEIDVDVFGDVDGIAGFSVGDQPPPSGTVISVKATNGTIESPSSITVPSTKEWGPYSFRIRWKGDTTPSAGSIIITATTPSGVTTVPTYFDVSD
jgi:hypothetical protein